MIGCDVQMLSTCAEAACLCRREAGCSIRASTVAATSISQSPQSPTTTWIPHSQIPQLLAWEVRSLPLISTHLQEVQAADSPRIRPFLAYPAVVHEI